jgi:regulatory protein YycI of two-component signal transduction system YycFG
VLYYPIFLLLHICYTEPDLQEGTSNIHQSVVEENEEEDMDDADIALFQKGVFSKRLAIERAFKEEIQAFINPDGKKGEKQNLADRTRSYSTWKKKFYDNNNIMQARMEKELANMNKNGLLPHEQEEYICFRFSLFFKSI